MKGAEPGRAGEVSDPGAPRQPLRVALVIDLFPPIVGGAETHARDLAVALVREGAVVTVLTRRAREELPAHEVLPPGVEVVRIGEPGSPRWGKYAFVPALLRAWRRRAADFDVACLCGFRVLGWPLLGATARTGTPLALRAEACGEMSGEFIWHPPGGVPSRGKRWIFAPLVRLRNRRLRRHGQFLAISSVVADEFRAAGVPAARLQVLPNGIDLERFRPPVPGEREALREEFGWAEGDLVFLYSGKLNRGKGLPALLAAWKEYVQGGGQGTLVLVGAGGGQFLSEEDHLRRTVEAGRLEGRVRFTGYRQDVERWLRAADVFVFPSESESFGLAPLEANATGLPVIATGAGALAETVPDGIAGRRVPVGDPAALCRAMIELAGDPAARERIGQSGRERVEREYSFGAVARRYLAWFEELAAGAGKGSERYRQQGPDGPRGARRA